jgi:peptide/nickel transport system permease protein
MAAAESLGPTSVSPRGPVPVDSPSPPPARRARLGSTVRTLWNVMRANPLTFAGFILVSFIVLLAVLVELVPFVTRLAGHAVYLYPYDPVTGFTSNRFAPPSSSHWLGTDQTGLDMFSRTLAALPIDLSLGVAIAGFGLVVGGLLGLIAGYWNTPWTVGGVVSSVILRATDVFLSIPSLLLALAIVEVAGRGYLQSIFALMVTWWPYYTRLVRGEVLAIKQQPFITAARAAGVPDRWILLRHVLRNLFEPVVVYFTMDVGTVIVVFSTVSFVAKPFPPTIPEWGSMIEKYVGVFPTYPWPVLSISLAIIITVLAFSLLGDGLRDILDPRSRRVLASGGASVDTTKSAAGTA